MELINMNPNQTTPEKQQGTNGLSAYYYCYCSCEGLWGLLSAVGSVLF